MFEKIQKWSRRRRFREGKTLSHFIACDVRRDILIVSAARIDEGIIIGRIRTTNVLYVSRGLAPQPEFKPVRELHIDEMWQWTGKSWGGLPDGTSIANHVQRGQPIDLQAERLKPPEVQRNTSALPALATADETARYDEGSSRSHRRLAQSLSANLEQFR